jgi:hypothetical protein
MQFTNAPADYTNNTCLQGYIRTTYDELVNIFGLPTEYKGDKLNVQWAILFSNGVVATIYDWKMSAAPLGVYDWHIGGKSKEAIDCVKDALPLIALM